jgi:hypothetical protein
VLLVACALWLVQSASVAFGIARFFVLPQAYSLARTAPFSLHTLEIAVLLASLLLSTPVTNTVSAKLMRAF